MKKRAKALNNTYYIFELVLIAAAYFGLAKSALLLPATDMIATPLWPPTGIALAFMLLRGYQISPAIFAGSFAATIVATNSFLASITLGVGVVFAALAGEWLLVRWVKSRKIFATPSSVAKFAVVTFAPTSIISSAFALASSFLAHRTGSYNTILTWMIWYLADAAGTLVIVPVMMLWASTPPLSVDKWNLLEATAIVVLATIVGAVAYSPSIEPYLIHSGIYGLASYRGILGYFIFIPLIWACLRGNQRNAATAALIFCGFAVWAFSADSPAFPKADLNGSLLLLFALFLSTSVPPLIIAAAIAARRDRETYLVSIKDQLSLEVSNTKSALDEAQRHFRILIEGVDDYAIFVVDTAGRIASWNSAAQKIFGYSSEEIIGRHVGIFYRPDDRRAGEPIHALESAIQEGKHEVEGWRIRKNGAPLFVTGSISDIRDDKGNLVGFANVLRDTTERRDEQEKLIQTREQLLMAQKMEAIGKLTGGIAHDFNNLLMIIGGSAQTFTRLLDPKLPRAIEAIQIAAKRGESLTRQLLTFSRRQQLSPTIADLNGCIRSMRTMIQSSLRGNIIYHQKIESDVRPVKVDLSEFELAIVNIAVNARDAMPSGGAFTLSISNVTSDHVLPAALKGAFVAIECRDTGTGIPPNLLSKIFDPFFTTKEVGKGTGLGLSQVYGFAHQAGGTVKAESSVGQGTTVTIYLPSSSEEEIASMEIPVQEDVGHKRPIVLIVDDSPEVAEVTSSLFEYLGYRPIYRESGESALKLLADGTKVDLVFTDIVMPGTIDGVALAIEMRTRFPNVPVILTTGYSDAAQAVPSDLKILRKPFDADVLKTFIQETAVANVVH